MPGGKVGTKQDHKAVLEQVISWTLKTKGI